MLTLQPSSYAFRLVQTLAVTGEYPVNSLPLLGNERVLKQLIWRLSLPEMFWNSHGEMVRTKLFVTNGKGREKSLRLYKGALPMLHWLHPDAYEYYMESFWNHHFPGDAAHRDRNHRVAEAVALCATAGVAAAMKWKGEFKALHSLTEVARLNGGVSHLDGALLFGKSYETALETLEFSDPRHPELRFDSIYPHIHFLPLDGFGARLLGILTLSDWQERLLDLLFEPSTRTYGRGTMEYDAQVGAVKVLSHLDGDLARLLRFREGLWSHSGKFEVVCFPQQAEFVRGFLGDRAEVREIPLEVVDKELLKGGDG